jgi:hypothetical protein
MSLKVRSKRKKNVCRAQGIKMREEERSNQEAMAEQLKKTQEQTKEIAKEENNIQIQNEARRLEKARQKQKE